RASQFLQCLGMDAKQCGCLLAVQEGFEFWKRSSWRHWFSLAQIDSGSAIATSGEWHLRQLFEQFAADAIEPMFFHDVELWVYADRFVEGQLPLPHVPNV